MTHRSVIVHPTAQDVAEAVAARVLLLVQETLAQRPTVHVVVTGGGVGIGSLKAMRSSPLAAAVDWSGVHLWWGDERFVPAGDPDRNEGQAHEALIDHIGIPKENVHVMLPPGAPGIETPEDSAAAYARELAAHAPEGKTAPEFDVVLLGMGPDGHIASLFPGHPGLDVTDVASAAVHDSPKPPPLRVTLTVPTIQSARQVWVLAAGAEKAPAVASALGGADLHETPAAAAIGRERTLWLLDTASAASAAG